MKVSTGLHAAAMAALVLASSGVWALDPATVPAAQRTNANLYLAAEEVMPFLAAKGGRTLFIDVRMPEELRETGSTPLIDANVPLALGQPPAFAGPAEFVTAVERRLAAKSLSKQDPVIAICRSGRRSAAAANLLTEAGFAHVYSVTDGFEGWKSKGLPWGYALATEKVTAAAPVR